MTVKIKVNRKTHAIEKITGNIGHTAQNMAGAKLYRHEIQPTFGHKLRRFIKRLTKYTVHQMRYKNEMKHTNVGRIPYIGIEAHCGRW